jgi:ribosome modulation factor
MMGDLVISREDLLNRFGMAVGGEGRNKERCPYSKIVQKSEQAGYALRTSSREALPRRPACNCCSSVSPGRPAFMMPAVLSRRSRRPNSRRTRATAASIDA